MHSLSLSLSLLLFFLYFCCYRRRIYYFIILSNLFLSSSLCNLHLVTYLFFFFCCFFIKRLITVNTKIKPLDSLRLKRRRKILIDDDYYENLNLIKTVVVGFVFLKMIYFNLFLVYMNKYKKNVL